MTIHDPDLDATDAPGPMADAGDRDGAPTPPKEPATPDIPADAAERLRDAEDALRSFYGRVVEVEAELARQTLRADKAEEKLAFAEAQLVKQNEALADAARVKQSEEHHRARTLELDQELRNAHEEIQALHNSRTMRAVAFPRRIYAKLRSLVR